MSAVMAIAGRELRERSRILLIALAVVVMMFVVSLLPGSRKHRGEDIALIGGFTSIAVGLGVAVALGTSVVAGELAQRRMSFYFSKPVSSAAIWFGKAGASIVISLAAFLIIAVPAWLVARQQWNSRWLGDALLPAIAVAGIVVLFLVSHVLSTVIRSRSAVLAIDFVMLLITLAAALTMMRPLIAGGAMETAGWVALGLGGAVVLVAAVAPVWQLESGRADIRRSHAALSSVLWPAVAVLLLLATAFVFWFTRVSPATLESVWDVVQPSRGDSVFLSGTSRGDRYHATFLLDGSTGAYERQSTPGWWGLRISRDGNVAAWNQPVGMNIFIWGRNEFELYVRRLDRPDAGRATGIRGRFASFTLSDDGARVAVASDDGLTVYETDSMKIVASTKMPEPLKVVRALFFVNSDTVRIVAMEPVRSVEKVPMRIHEFDIPRRRMQRTGERLIPSTLSSVAASEDGGLMFVRGTTEILDGRTGALRATAEAVPASRFGSALLHDGRLAVIGREQPMVLRLFDSAGAPLRAIALPAEVRGAMVTAEMASGRVLVYARTALAGKGGGMMLVIDPDTGTVVHTMPGLSGPMPNWGGDPRLVRYAAGQWLAGLDAKRQLVLWNPETGARKPLPVS